MAITAEGDEEAAVEELGEEEETSMYNVEYIPRVSRSNYLRLYLRPCSCISYVFHVAWQQLWQEAATAATAAAVANKSNNTSNSNNCDRQARFKFIKTKRQSRNAIASASEKCRYKCICISISICICIEWMLSLFCPGAWAGSARPGPARHVNGPRQNGRVVCYSCCTLLLYMT